MTCNTKWLCGNTSDIDVDNMSPSYFSKNETEFIVSSYKQGISLKEIAEMVRCSQSMVKACLEQEKVYVSTKMMRKGKY